MFDLERIIAAWRQKMSAHGITSPEVLDELEAHLRDDIEGRINAGANEQEAFEAATAAIGQAGLIGEEFVKLETSHVSSKWFHILFPILPVLMVLINTWTLLVYDLSILERGMGILANSVICLCLIRWPKFCAALCAAEHKRLAKGIKVASTLLFFWPILALLEAVHLAQLRLGIVANVVLWNLYTACALVNFWNFLNPRFRGLGGSSSPFSPLKPGGQPISPDGPRPPDHGAALLPLRPLDPIMQQLLNAAADEADCLGHDFVGTEHVLLGLMRNAQGSFANILKKLSLNREAVQSEIERLVARGPIGPEPAPRPLTPRAGKAVAIAAREARTSNHAQIAPEHLFLGLLLERSGVAAKVLRKLGIRAKRVRLEILSELRTRPLR